jgi:hypothetical protein
MSKNQDRYKEDYINLIENVEELEELETKKFEKFSPKKKNPPKSKREEIDRNCH